VTRRIELAVLVEARNRPEKRERALGAAALECFELLFVRDPAALAELRKSVGDRPALHRQLLESLKSWMFQLPAGRGGDAHRPAAVSEWRLDLGR